MLNNIVVHLKNKGWFCVEHTYATTPRNRIISIKEEKIKHLKPTKFIIFN